MNTSITQVLAKATGPSRLRSELRLKTKSVRTLLKAFHPVSIVQTEVPQSVLGGDIVMLMSGRLRQVLQYSEQPEIEPDAGSANRSRLAAQPGVAVSSAKTKFSMNSVSVKESAAQWTPLQSMSRAQNSSSPIPDSGKNATESDPFTPLQVPKVAQTDLEPETGESLSNRPSISGKKDRIEKRKTNLFTPLPVPKVAQTDLELKNKVPHNNQPQIRLQENRTKEPERRRQTVTPIFVKKLQEYWQLNQREQTSDSNSNRPVDVKKSGGKQGTSFSPLPDTPGVSHVWPEMTGEQIARKIHEFASGHSVSGSSKHVQQTIHSSLPEKVEIQNVFNVEVKPDGDKGTGSSTDLAEKVADILREQALQHGIDIT